MTADCFVRHRDYFLRTLSHVAPGLSYVWLLKQVSTRGYHLHLFISDVSFISTVTNLWARCWDDFKDKLVILDEIGLSFDMAQVGMGSTLLNQEAVAMALSYLHPMILDRDDSLSQKGSSKQNDTLKGKRHYGSTIQSY